MVHAGLHVTLQGRIPLAPTEAHSPGLLPAAFDPCIDLGMVRFDALTAKWTLRILHAVLCLGTCAA
jgi:hypothetical protein